MVKTLNCGVTLGTFQAAWTLVPTDLLGEDFTVFWGVLEDFGRTAEVPHVVRINTAFAVMAVLLGRAPGRLVHKHIEDKSIFVQVEALKVEIQVGASEQTNWHEVILDTFVLEVQVDIRDCLQIPQPERRHLVWRP